MSTSSKLDGLDADQLHRVRQFLPYCEGIGDNCEFGFLMRELGYEKGGFFRWAVTPFDALVKYIQERPPRLYDLENLVPMSAVMVCDRATMFGYHTKMLSIADGSGYRFVDDETTRRAVHLQEAAKVVHLSDSFESRLREGRCVFVVKRNTNLTEFEVSNLVNALGSQPGFATSSLLVVRATDDAKLAGTVSCQDPRLIEGWVSRFAPYTLADDIAYESWIPMLEKTASIFGVPS